MLNLSRDHSLSQNEYSNSLYSDHETFNLNFGILLIAERFDYRHVVEEVLILEMVTKSFFFRNGDMLFRF